MVVLVVGEHVEPHQSEIQTRLCSNFALQIMAKKCSGHPHVYSCAHSISHVHWKILLIYHA